MLHFVALAAVIFLAYAWLSPPAQPPRDRIVVTAQDADRLRAQFQGLWSRDPTDAELGALVEKFVREEIYYREGVALGLDLGDQVVRMRMGQKMEFLLSDPARLPTPTETELVALFEATKGQYAPPASIAFRQVFLGDATAEATAAALDALARPGTDPAVLAAPSLLPPRMDGAPPAVVDAAFGQGFFDGLAALPPGKWAGPVRSALGQHLVFVEAMSAGDAPAFADVRPAVEDAWRRDAARALADAEYAALRSRYDIDLSGAGVRE